jgi:hypothetical protein
MAKAAGYDETSVCIYQTTERFTPESDKRNKRRENVKFPMQHT